MSFEEHPHVSLLQHEVKLFREFTQRPISMDQALLEVK